MKQVIRHGSFCTALLALVSLASADVKLPTLFTDNMVLQQGKGTPVWGWANDNEQVTVSYQGEKLTTKAKGGKWMVNFKNLRVAGPGVMTIDGRNRIELQNVVVGEVWVCSGQSNMEWSLAQLDIKPNEIPHNPNLRLFKVGRKKSEEPLADFDMPWNTGRYGWAAADSQSAPDFSAVAYYFGTKLQKDLGVPVGLIASSWGGTPIEVWLGPDVVKSHGELTSRYLEALAEFKDGKTKREPWMPGILYNGMISPMVGYGAKGAIWYQGESNTSHAWEYRELLPDMVKQWRTSWGINDFTFITVQLAPWDKNRKREMADITKEPGDSDWAELREGQSLFAEKDPRGGIVVITDLGEKDNIHPKAKQPVGDRLALAARGIAYKEKVTYSGPVLKSVKVEKGKGGPGKILVRFDSVGEGLMAKGDKLTGFAICGADQKWMWADAEIVGADTVAVSHADLTEPEAVRFGWADYPVVNLFNKEGLPASPFRTDKFKLTTEP